MASSVTGSTALTRTWSSIDSASRMPPIGHARDERDGLGRHGPALGGEDALELALDLGRSRGVGT